MRAARARSAGSREPAASATSTSQRDRRRAGRSPSTTSATRRRRGRGERQQDACARRSGRRAGRGTARRRAAPTAYAAATAPAVAYEPVVIAHEEHDREPVEPDRARARSASVASKPRDVRRAEDRGVALRGPSCGSGARSRRLRRRLRRRCPARPRAPRARAITTVTCSSKSTPSSSAPSSTSSRFTAAAKLGCLSFFFTDLGVRPWMPCGPHVGAGQDEARQLVDGEAASSPCRSRVRRP